MRRSCLADVKIDVTISNEIKSNVRTPVITILLDFVSKHIADFGAVDGDKRVFIFYVDFEGIHGDGSFRLVSLLLLYIKIMLKYIMILTCKQNKNAPGATNTESVYRMACPQGYKTT